jgi:hypothetical protein
MTEASAVLAEQASAVEVRLAEESDNTLWKSFLADSSNGTLFHDLNFLRYHPPERFRVHNLIFYYDKKVVALLPASLVADREGRLVLRSPYGASFGGFVIGRRLPLRYALALVECLRAYAERSGFAGIEIVLGPTAYSHPLHDLFGFALLAGGFCLAQRWLNPMVPLVTDPELALASVSSKRRSTVRCAVRDGVEVGECPADRLPEFYEVLAENRGRHGAVPTHTLAELQRIFQLIPDRVRLFLCMRHGELLGGTVVFELNSQAVYSIQPAHRDCFKQHQPPAVLLHHLLQHYGRRGFRYLDLGPTGHYDTDQGKLTLNAGNAFFKEEMGGVAFHRERWTWNAT